MGVGRGEGKRARACESRAGSERDAEPEASLSRARGITVSGGWGGGARRREACKNGKVGGKAGSTQTAEEGGGELVEGEGSGLGYGQWAPEFWLGVGVEGH